MFRLFFPTRENMNRTTSGRKKSGCSGRGLSTAVAEGFARRGVADRDVALVAVMKRTKPQGEAKPIPKVRIARPEGRPFQLRYTCPKEKREIRISIGSCDENEAVRLKAELKARLLLGI